MPSPPIDLTFRSNQRWFLPFNMKDWAVLYDLTTGEYRLQIRTTEVNPVVVYSFDNLGTAGVGQGTIAYNPVTQLMIIEASYADVKTYMSLAGSYVYDLQYTRRDPISGSVVLVRDLCFGTLTISNGVTRS